MNKKEAFDLLCETLTDYSFHPLFLKELGELLNKDLKGKEKVFFKCLTVQLNYINTFGTMVHTTAGHEQIHGFNGCYYSIHVEQSQFNVRLLVHIDGVSSPVFLCAFYERSGHRATSYERYTSVLENRYNEMQEGNSNG
ncbi:MAG: hypothetical protein LUC90_05710 [Lachnospiraceae bacterium]|nr:hypothetical protein [Lachnospiraceae bacterium]